MNTKLSINYYLKYKYLPRIIFRAHPHWNCIRKSLAYKYI